MDTDGEFGFTVVGEGEGKGGREIRGKGGYEILLSFALKLLNIMEGGREGGRAE